MAIILFCVKILTDYNFITIQGIAAELSFIDFFPIRQKFFKVTRLMVAKNCIAGRKTTVYV